MKKIHQIQGEVTFGRAIGDFFKGYFDFKGRTTRAGYWWVVLVLSILILFGSIFFLPLIVFWSSQSDSGTSIFVYLIITLIVFLALLIPSFTLAIRRYRDAGLRGRGFLVLWILSMAANYTNIEQTIQNISVGSMLNDSGYIQSVQSGSAIITFLSYLIGLLFFVLTVLPTDTLTTKSKNEIVRFFLREKNN